MQVFKILTIQEVLQLAKEALYSYIERLHEAFRQELIHVSKYIAAIREAHQVAYPVYTLANAA